MKKIIAITLVMVLALSLLTACGDGGGGSSNTPSGGNNTPSGNNSTPSGNNGGDTYDPKDHFTAVEVDIDFVEDWMLPTDGVITEVELENDVLMIYKITVEGISKAQSENYEKTLESKGMANFMDTWGNNDVSIDFTKTFLKDKPEDSSLVLRIGKR
jgi:hypothetical protein